MSVRTCPTSDEWIRLIDGQLTEERARGIRGHEKSCERCARERGALSQMTDDLRSNVVRADAQALTNEVMARLDDGIVEQVERQANRIWPMRRWMLVAAAILSTLVAGIAAVSLVFRSPAENEFAARGRKQDATLRRNVGVVLYGVNTRLDTEQDTRRNKGGRSEIQNGAKVTRATGYVAGYRNLGVPVYLLLFAVDSVGATHWIEPAFEREGENPRAIELRHAEDEQLGESAVAFDDIAEGAIHVFAIVSPEPMVAGDVERLPVGDRTSVSLGKKWPHALVNEWTLFVVSEGP